MLEARDLYCERDERTLFRGLSFTMEAGEWVQVTGGNGAGKTTLLRLLTGLARPDGGEVYWRLALGLRTRLQNDAGNVEGWLMLGRTGMVLGNAGTATGAYANAYRLDPKNRDAALGYAEALTRSSDPEDNRRGGELLRQLVSRDHTDIRVLSLYAFSAFEQQRFGEAVAAWEMMLKLLPAGDARRAVIERSIRLAQEK
ncbi:ATP-binding cassette domain-containing protein [Salmonella enterica]|uniref:TPR domain-containing protein n=1 Tax=Salmonella enterica TaxID=28901 RepID=UPI00290573C3|nr:ATP-binding cassette domain-containing protein [Salmonella enterica]